MIYKITEGYVKQTFDENGKCIAQYFVGGRNVEYENPETGETIKPAVNMYHAFDMIQPHDDTNPYLTRS